MLGRVSTTPAPSRATTGRTRLLGVDAARGLALLGMMGTHLVSSTAADGGVSWVYEVFSGRASALFAVLAGVGLALATGRAPDRLPPRGRDLRAARAGVLARAGVIAAVGLAVGLAPGNIYVILVYYGLLFAVGSLFVGLGARALAVLAGAWLVLAPVASHLLRQLLVGPPGAPSYDVPSPASLLDPVGLLTGLALTGVYPVLTWTGYLLVGLAVGRMPLDRVRTATTLLVTGVVLAVAAPLASAAALGAAGGSRALEESLPPSWGLTDLDRALAVFLPGSTPTTSWAWLFVDAPHSATPFDLLATSGSALAVLGLALLVASAGPVVRLTAAEPRPLGALLLVPLAAAGSATLTLYTLHVLTAGATSAVLGQEGAWVLHAAAAVVLGLALREAGSRGPLEQLAFRASAAARRRAAGGSQAPVRR